MAGIEIHDPWQQLALNCLLEFPGRGVPDERDVDDVAGPDFAAIAGIGKDQRLVDRSHQPRLAVRAITILKTKC